MHHPAMSPPNSVCIAIPTQSTQRGPAAHRWVHSIWTREEERGDIQRDGVCLPKSLLCVLLWLSACLPMGGDEWIPCFACTHHVCFTY